MEAEAAKNQPNSDTSLEFYQRNLQKSIILLSYRSPPPPPPPPGNETGSRGQRSGGGILLSHHRGRGCTIPFVICEKLAKRGRASLKLTVAIRTTGGGDLRFLFLALPRLISLAQTFFSSSFVLTTPQLLDWIGERARSCQHVCWRDSLI